MISVKKSTESNGKHAFVVECRLLPLLDGKQQQQQQHEDVTRTKKFMCKGWDDRDAQSKVLRFVMATDVVSAFREFLFNEPDGCAMARREGSLAAGATIARPDGVMPLGSSLGKIGFEEAAKRKIRSFVCVRRKQACGLKYAVALCRTENGCLRSISFHEEASSVDKDGAVRSAEDQAVDRAVLFLRSVAFESWRKQGVAMEALQREREQGGAMIGSKHARERGLKHPCSFAEMEQGEKVDCSCGKNRSRGLMLACERCGAWEHAECKGYRNDKQIPADYVCSACERAQREEVIVIRLEEQVSPRNLRPQRGLFNREKSADLWTDEKIKEKEGDEPVCCVCGCEDNEDLEALIQACSCDAGSSVAHPNCVTAAINKASQRGHPTQGSELAICHICGDETGGIVTGAQNAVASKDMGSLNSNTRSSTRAMKADQSLRGTKRLRSALTNGALPAKGEIVEKRPAKSCKDETDGHVLQQPKPDTPVSDQGKLDVPLLGRRFSDAAATVPIKKRRIQLLDVVRSPSPPIRMASPRAHMETLTGYDGSEADAKPECAQNLEGAETVEVEQLVLKGPSIGEATVSEVGYGKQGLETGRHQLKEDERDRVGDYHGRNFDDEEVVGACKVITTGNIVGSKGKRVDAVLDMIKVVTEDSQVIKANDIDYDSVGKPKEKFKLVCRNRELNDYHIGEGKDKVDAERKLPRGGMSSRSRPSDTRDLALKLGQAVQEAVEGGEFSCSEPSIEGSYGDHRNGPLCEDLRAGEEDSSSMGATDKESDVSGARDECCNCTENESTVSEFENTNTGTASTSRQSSRTRDDRLHWDLNMDYAEWERPTEEDTAWDMELNSGVTAETSGEARQRSQEIQGEHQSVQLDGYKDSDTILEKGKLQHQSTPVRVPDVVGSSDLTACVGRVGEVLVTQVTTCHAEQLASSKVARWPGLHRASPDGPKNAPFTHAEGERAQVEVEDGKGLCLEAGNLKNEDPLAGVDTLADRDTYDIAATDADESDHIVGDCSHLVVENTSAGPPIVAGETFVNAAEATGPSVQGAEEMADNVGTSNSAGAAGYQGGESVHKKVDNNALVETTSLSPIFSDKQFAEFDGSNEELSADVKNVGPSDDVSMEGRTMSDGELSPSSPHGRNSFSHKWEADAVEELDAEHVDYGDSDCRDGDELEADDGRQLSATQAESKLEVVDSGVEGPADLLRTSLGPMAKPHITIPESQGGQGEYSTNFSAEGELLSKVVCQNSGDCSDSSTGGKIADASREHDEAFDRGSSKERNEITVNKEDRHLIKHEQKFVVKSEISGMRSEVIGRVKLSGWDQLPEGFDKAEDALRAAKEGSGRGGRGVPQWANHPGWGSSINNIGPISSHIGPGPGRGSLVRNDPQGERARSDLTRSRDDRSYGHRVDDGFELSPRLSSHEIGHSRGRGGGSLDLSRGRGRPDPWFNSPSGPPTPWRLVPSGHQSPPGRFPEPGFSPRGSTNAAAVAAAKVESSGFIVAPDGTVIKVGSPAAGPIRGSPRSFGPGGRGGRRSSLFSMGGRGGGGLNMALPGVATMGPGDNMRGGGRGLGGRRSMSIGLSMAMGVGPGISANTSGRGALTRDRGFNRFSGPFSPRGVDPMTESPSGRLGSRYGDEWGHRDRTPSPPLSRHTRISPVRRPRSGSRPRSRSRSPRMHTSPKPLTSNIGGSVLPASPQPKKSHSPITNHKPLESKPDTWPKSHAEKPESPSRRLVPPPPKLPLPPPPPRNQRSPPAGLKRLSGKREVDQFRERGKDREREKEQDWERERPVPRIRTPPPRTSPHVVHGSALMDERDLQLLAGIRNVSPAGRHRRRNELSASGPPSSQEQSPHSSRGRSADGASDLRRTTGDEPGEHDRDTHGARREDFVAKGGERNLEALRSGNDIDSRFRRMGAGAWRDRGGQDDELRAKDAHNHNSRDGGKNGGSSKYTSSREGDDDVAPRRRRPPP
ncbi:unnamed protein product [Sphagnum tenellum]